MQYSCAVWQNSKYNAYSAVWINGSLINANLNYRAYGILKLSLLNKCTNYINHNAFLKNINYTILVKLKQLYI